MVRGTYQSLAHLVARQDCSVTFVFDFFQRVRFMENRLFYSREAIRFSTFLRAIVLCLQLGKHRLSGIASHP